ncbi:MAG: hypothetical protein NTU44_15300 [Bacteroidetes bacterium]|nr:hypothetical protein [Bacteroidota bacterium]
MEHSVAGKAKKSSKKSEQIDVKIHEVRELEFFCKEISNELIPDIDQTNIQLGFGLKIGTNKDQKTLEISLKIIYSCKIKSEICNLLSFETLVTFHISNYDKVVFFNEPNVPSFDEGFLISMLGVTIGTARGMIFTKTTGHFINKFYLPILNPQELFKALVKSQQQEAGFQE